MTESNVVELPNKEKQKELPVECEGTDGYLMATVNYTHQSLSTVPDLATGGKRNKRWGVIFAIGVVPNLDESPPGPLIMPQAVPRFFDSDELESLRARLNYEIDVAIEQAEEMKADPEGYYRKQMEMAGQVVSNAEGDTSVATESAAQD